MSRISHQRSNGSHRHIKPFRVSTSAPISICDDTSMMHSPRPLTSIEILMLEEIGLNIKDHTTARIGFIKIKTQNKRVMNIQVYHVGRIQDEMSGGVISGSSLMEAAGAAINMSASGSSIVNHDSGELIFKAGMVEMDSLTLILEEGDFIFPDQSKQYFCF
ncbi:hypothetical protein WICPIJ_005550 [Wickerhamomyces pijperi]|uniref:Uncharacterized protein n=1 Tax=Wickerhamomyces pijperi TaxID=599730 RepID=A0A9P8TM87_WICPI|nr:hypothetical protein WICPIJ_005550 [Wickerhamomyces pijperi]